MMCPTIHVVLTRVIMPTPLIRFLTSPASLAPLTTLTSSLTSHVPRSSPQLLPLSVLSTLMPSALHLLLVSVALMVMLLRTSFCLLSLTIQVVWGKKPGLSC